MGWGSLLDRITGWLPIQKPVERLKNELEKLEQERQELLSQKADLVKAKRIGIIEHRIDAINILLKNKANDS